jgi:16S rRNA (guanine1516-N2)-methyltransferase
MPRIVLVDRTGNPARTREISRQLSIPQVESVPTEAEFVLWLLPEGLSIQANEPSPPSPLRVEFVSGKAAYRRKQGEMIVRAVNIKGLRRSPRVLDVTAGLGRDAFVLASHGFTVTLLERDPIIHALLADGLARAQADSTTCEVAERMTLHHIDAAKWVEETGTSPDVVYLDPMFPGRQKSAKVKKEMLLFQRLLRESDDAAQLLAHGLAMAGRKVLVKRPLKAEPIAGPKPSHALCGKSIRFDVYPVGSNHQGTR